jgi:hypothetical protein
MSFPVAGFLHLLLTPALWGGVCCVIILGVMVSFATTLLLFIFTLDDHADWLGGSTQYPLVGMGPGRIGRPVGIALFDHCHFKGLTQPNSSQVIRCDNETKGSVGREPLGPTEHCARRVQIAFFHPPGHVAAQFDPRRRQYPVRVH